MKFLVTGATGFAGSHLVDLLVQEGHEVTATSRGNTDPEWVVSPAHVCHMDLEQPTSINEVFENDTFDGVFHLGAYSVPINSFADPIKPLTVNAIGTAHICDQIIHRMPKCVLMQCSTPEVYGDVSDEQITEDTPLNPNNPYAVGKAAADLCVTERIYSEGLHAFFTRAFSHTGPRRRETFSISSDAIQIARILREKQEPVIHIGNMKSKRVVADVRDIVKAYYRLMIAYIARYIEREVFHIAGNELRSMRFFLDKMLELYNLTGKVTLKEDPKLFRKVDIPVMIPNDDKVRCAIDWEPKIEIEETLSDLVDYWLERV